MSFMYDALYRYYSSAGPHPTLMAGDLLFEKHPKGLVLRGEPTAQFVSPPVYLHGAWHLYEALQESGELTPELSLPELPSIGHGLYALLKEWTNMRLPNWRELLPPEAFDQTMGLTLGSLELRSVKPGQRARTDDLPGPRPRRPSAAGFEPVTPRL